MNLESGEMIRNMELVIVLTTVIRIKMEVEMETEIKMVIKGGKCKPQEEA